MRPVTAHQRAGAGGRAGASADVFGGGDGVPGHRFCLATISLVNTQPTAAAPPLVPALLPAAAPPDRHPAAVYLRSLGSPVSRRNMASALRSIVRTATGGASDDVGRFPWHELRFQHVTALKSRLSAAGMAPATANVRLAAVRGVLRAAWRLDLIDTDAWQRAADVGPVRGERLPAGRALEMAEIAALFASCADGTAGGARDAALLSLLYGAGLRRAEAAAVRVADVEEADGGLTVRIVGKGNRERQVFADNGGGAAIRAWLDVRGREPGPLLCAVHRHGRVSPAAAMTPSAIRQRIVERCRRADVAPASPHDLRRTFVSQLLDATGDAGSVQRLAGHASVNTTMRYDRRGERAARRAAALLHVPYQGAGGGGS